MSTIESLLCIYLDVLTSVIYATIFLMYKKNGNIFRFVTLENEPLG